MPYQVISQGAEPDPAAFANAVEIALMRAAAVLQRELSTPPPKRPGEKHLAGPEPGGFYTSRQRSFVMANIRRGTLKVPYLRTGNLERSWSITKLLQDREGLYVEVFSDPTEAPYNELVQQDDPAAKRQAVPMHDDWPKPLAVAARVQAEVEQIIEKTLKEMGFI